MPFSKPGQAKLNALSGISNRTDLVSVSLPTAVYGAIIDIDVTIRPTWDQACPGNVAGITADVWIESESRKTHICGVDDGAVILHRIKTEMPSAWAEIELKADENFRDGARAA